MGIRSSEARLCVRAIPSGEGGRCQGGCYVEAVPVQETVGAKHRATTVVAVDVLGEAAIGAAGGVSSKITAHEANLT
eukprot:5189903-Pleurochrysis_carterae.AAC.1